MSEDLQKRAMAVDYAIKFTNANNVASPEVIPVDEFMGTVLAIYNFLKEEIK